MAERGEGEREEEEEGRKRRETASAAVEEADKREQAYAMIKAIELFKTEVTKMVDNGKLAQRAIERAQKVTV